MVFFRLFGAWLSLLGFFSGLFSFVCGFLLLHSCVHVLWFLDLSFYFLCFVFYYMCFWIFPYFAFLFEAVSVCFAVLFGMVFSLVVGSEGNTFSHRHQLWFGLPFGCKFLGNKSPVFCLTFEAVDVW